MIRLLSLILPFTLLLSPVSASADDPAAVVRAVLFYAPTCPHCHKLINEDLPVFFEGELGTLKVYAIPTAEGEEQIGWPAFSFVGEQLEILCVNTHTQLGGILYENMAEQFQIPPEERFVPLMVVGETVLIGSIDIPSQLPDIITRGLASGGIDWPDISQLDSAVGALTLVEMDGQEPPESSVTQVAGEIAAPAEDSPSTPEPSEMRQSILDKIKLDPVGNSISILVLAGMVASVIALGTTLVRGRIHGASLASKAWPFLVFCLAGIGVAGYLTFVETTSTAAICGPVGDCNAVQQSEYSRLFGVIPVAALGMAGYIAMLAAWLIARLNQDTRLGNYAAVAIFAMAAFGVMFSMYLTALEPFVIGATCAWCLSSATIMTILMWLSSSPAMEAWGRLRKAAS